MRLLGRALVAPRPGAAGAIGVLRIRRAVYGVDAGTTGVRWAWCDAEGTVRAAASGGRGSIAAALPCDEAIFRVLRLPSLEGRELRSAMRWELQRILPFPVEDGVFDFAPLPGEPTPGGRSDAQSTADGRRYAVSGALVSSVERRLSALHALGIRPAVLEPEWATFWRLATDLQEGGAACGVVDLGATSSRLVVVDQDGTPVAWHRSQVGGLALGRELASALGVAPEEAEGLKTAEFATDLGPLASAPALAELVGDLARALRRVQQELPTVKLSLWAVGGGALWPALLSALSEAMGLELRPLGTAEAAARTPVGTLDPRWALAGELARWHLARRTNRREKRLRWPRRRHATGSVAKGNVAR